MTRDSLHKLIDGLPETELPTVARVLEALHAAADPARGALDNAPEDEAAAVAAAWEERRVVAAGRTCAELRRLRGKVPFSIEWQELRQDRP